MCRHLTPSSLFRILSGFDPLLKGRVSLELKTDKTLEGNQSVKSESRKSNKVWNQKPRSQKRHQDTVYEPDT